MTISMTERNALKDSNEMPTTCVSGLGIRRESRLDAATEICPSKISAAVCHIAGTLLSGRTQRISYPKTDSGITILPRKGYLSQMSR
ncbi:uncharacterized protein N7469_000635 [Penicillium citrinum]|uniref:Uncharacterized protein n=2 Tax=Penicillium TaxID=5073 RepID=A0A9W9PG27_PENCI|nr:uncharacterized protein N7469_000635 [Penicillium citrinum]KAJ5242308.1 hypothetical protein N7469_000635 [Penicillium citrinum]KAJ5600201.1 hypothetical protein N7450_001268 [Penicillium hetheringtonii]